MKLECTRCQSERFYRALIVLAEVDERGEVLEEDDDRNAKCTVRTEYECAICTSKGIRVEGR